MLTFLQLFEIRKGQLTYLKQLVPDWPDYVVKDLLYRVVENDPKYATEFLNNFYRSYGRKQWHLDNVTLNFESFTSDTQRRMKERNMGKTNPYKVPRDKERHIKQKELLIKQGPKEPVILVKKDSQYDLLEGWHRTLQALQLFPEGYTQPAYIYR